MSFIDKYHMTAPPPTEPNIVDTVITKLCNLYKFANKESYIYFELWSFNIQICFILTPNTYW